MFQTSELQQKITKNMAEIRKIARESTLKTKRGEYNWKLLQKAVK